MMNRAIMLASVPLAFCFSSAPSPAPKPSVDKVIYIIRHGEKIHSNDPAEKKETVQCLSEKGWARAYNMKSIFGSTPRPGIRVPDALFSAEYGEDLECKDRHGWYRTQQTISAVAAGPREYGGLGLEIDNTLGWMPKLCDDVMYDCEALQEVPAKLAEMKDLSPSEQVLTQKLVQDMLAEGKCGGTCVPYVDGELNKKLSLDASAGTCCNSAAAKAIKAKLMEPGIDTILVAWEHINIQWLAAELGAPTAKVYNYAEGPNPWPSDDYDKIYKLTYTADGEFKSFHKKLSQGFSTDGQEFLGHNETGTCGPVGD